MKILLIIVLILIGGGLWYVSSGRSIEDIPNTVSDSISELAQNTPASDSSNSNSSERLQVIAQGLDTPWGLAIFPDNSILVTERKGTVRLIDSSGVLQVAPVATISSVREIGEGGLLGITLHPSFAANNYVYVYYTYNASGNNTMNRVSRFTFINGKLSDEKTIVDAIPGAANHDGGRIKFGPDGNLYIGTGDAQEPSRAQDQNNLAGKILRVTENGDAVPGNPFNNRIYSYGHRNVQGLAWDTNGQLWATEHGRSGGLSGLDELNKIEAGKNYGWPEIQGTETRDGMVTPFKNSGNTTWAPSGMAFLNGSLYFSGLRGETLYKANPKDAADLKEYLKGEYGRIRDVVADSNGMLYVTTSNKDGRGVPDASDDRILRINPEKL